jgi:hypothetical protein
MRKFYKITLRIPVEAVGKEDPASYLRRVLESAFLSEGRRVGSKFYEVLAFCAPIAEITEEEVE